MTLLGGELSHVCPFVFQVGPGRLPNLDQCHDSQTVTALSMLPLSYVQCAERIVKV